MPCCTGLVVSTRPARCGTAHVHTSIDIVPCRSVPCQNRSEMLRATCERGKKVSTLQRCQNSIYLLRIMVRKRSFEDIESIEVENFDSVDKPISSANIHGVVTSLSPIKKGRMRNYFDGTSKMRMIGFNSKQRTMMNEFSEKRETVMHLSMLRPTPPVRG